MSAANFEKKMKVFITTTVRVFQILAVCLVVVFAFLVFMLWHAVTAVRG